METRSLRALGIGKNKFLDCRQPKATLDNLSRKRIDWKDIRYIKELVGKLEKQAKKMSRNEGTWQSERQLDHTTGTVCLPCHYWTLTVTPLTALSLLSLHWTLAAATSNINDTIIYCSCFFVLRFKVLSPELPNG